MNNVIQVEQLVKTFSGRRNVDRCRIASGISDATPGFQGPNGGGELSATTLLLFPLKFNIQGAASNRPAGSILRF